MSPTLTGRNKWLALILLCLGDVMIVLDSTVVNIALPTIAADLQFSETDLVWVVNAYMLTYGGFLLLGGRLGDLFGHRKLFLIGIVGFTVASLACGLANSQVILVVARAIQGLGGAVVTAVALSLIMNLFTEPKERAKAMGVFGFVSSAGGSIGVLLGGAITANMDWHWIFLINIPIGAAVFFFSLPLLPRINGKGSLAQMDIAGALTVTASLMLAVYAIVNGNEIGWRTNQTMGMLGAAGALFLLFLFIESRVKSPLMPLGLFRVRNIAGANIAAVLWAAAMFAWFFISALYLQQVLKYSPMEVGLAFLPSNIIMAIFSLGLSAKIVLRFGNRIPLFLGLLCVAAGLALFSQAPVDGNIWRDVMPGMMLLGLGCGVAFNPLLLAAMSDVKPDESGLASGVVNTAFMMGGSVGLAVLASIAARETLHRIASGESKINALNGGYNMAFIIGALFALVAALVALLVLRKGRYAEENAEMAGGH